jgi:hypothetical protein
MSNGAGVTLLAARLTIINGNSSINMHLDK